MKINLIKNLKQGDEPHDTLEENNFRQRKQVDSTCGLMLGVFEKQKANVAGAE